MEAWISLIALDSQTSSQIVSEKSLRALSKDLKKSSTLSQDTFNALTNALAEKFDSLDPRRIPSDIFTVCGKMQSVQSNYIRYTL